MKILSLLSKLWQADRPKPPTVSQMGVQARAIRHLIARGSIDARTVFLMGTTDAHKMFTRMRRMGLLFDAANPQRAHPCSQQVRKRPIPPPQMDGKAACGLG
ncbi:hypothetical protein GR211_21990 [Rhizobium leguminosarum]|uniref:hypothetical protein n=1 Tax=Rhizobium ruizarguesonis TaxID=2081791 RepID=UPI0013B87F57|nr:hypothetical protein [Rhizobium ruizarguesonis]NEJ15491.1 hypothetical protein [Rhizobium ruizarguesonis]NEK29566.1 hypothetical protein [Rhizobium ruizarguesonis]